MEHALAGPQIVGPPSTQIGLGQGGFNTMWHNPRADPATRDRAELAQRVEDAIYGWQQAATAARIYQRMYQSAHQHLVDYEPRNTDLEMRLAQAERINADLQAYANRAHSEDRRRQRQEDTDDETETRDPSVKPEVKQERQPSGPSVESDEEEIEETEEERDARFARILRALPTMTLRELNELTLNMSLPDRIRTAAAYEMAGREGAARPAHLHYRHVPGGESNHRYESAGKFTFADAEKLIREGIERMPAFLSRFM